MQYVSFTCMHCERRLKARRELAGKVAKCPKCHERTEVPGAEAAGVAYALAGESAPTTESVAPKNRPSADIWQALGYVELSAKSRRRLDEARALSGQDEWERAVSLLNDLFRASAGGQMTRENAVFRTPLSYCLTRWSVEVLGRLDPAADLSKPMRRLLEVAAEKQKWGGVFDIAECGLCRQPLKSIAGRASVRTTVGTAYLCCAKPTKDDQRLVGEVNAIWQRLCLATVLDDQNENAWYAMRRLPSWQASFRVEKISLGRGNSWARWDAETDGLLSELIEAVIEKSIEGAIEGISGGFD
jgi:hypothetical protein